MKSIKRKIEDKTNQYFHYVYNIHNNVDGNYAEKVSGYFNNYTYADFLEVIEKRKQLVLNLNYSIKLKVKPLLEGELTEAKEIENNFFNEIVKSFNAKFEELMIKAKEERNKKLFVLKNKNEKRNIKKFLELNKGDLGLSLKSQLVFKHIKSERSFYMPEDLSFLNTENIFVLAYINENNAEIQKENYFIEKGSLQFHFDESIFIKDEETNDMLSYVWFEFKLKNEEEKEIFASVKYDFECKKFYLDSYSFPYIKECRTNCFLGNFIPNHSKLFLNEQDLGNEVSSLKHRMSIFIKNN